MTLMLIIKSLMTLCGKKTAVRGYFQTTYRC